jgi:rare lipoprotein A
MIRKAILFSFPGILLASEPVFAKQEMIERGVASWYGSLLHGHATASGVPMDRQQLTAAHRTLPLGTVVEIVNARNGRKVTVTITDRGPGLKQRIIDVSPVAAAQLGMKRRGLALVELRKPLFE